MYIKAAVCDDEAVICSQVEQFVTEACHDINIQCDIDVFSSGEEVCRILESEQYDILFLDIKLAGIDGVEVGRYIREELGNETIQIAYISSETEFAMKLFDSRPINFIIKPLDLSKIKKVIDKYIKIRNYDNLSFEYQKGSVLCKAVLKDILYFESTGRKVKIVTDKYTDVFYGSIKAIYPKLSGGNFLMIHKSIIVNYNYIIRYEYEKVTMADGTVMPVSQSKRKETRGLYMKLRGEDE